MKFFSCVFWVIAFAMLLFLGSYPPVYKVLYHPEWTIYQIVAEMWLYYAMAIVLAFFLGLVGS